MADKFSNADGMKQDMEALIDALDLSDLQKHFMRSRWLDQVMYMGNRANAARDWHYRLRITTIVAGVIVPGLVSLNFADSALTVAIRLITFGLSLLVGITAAVEQFFNFGERWRRYRQTCEIMKIEGWSYFQLSGPYRRAKSHTESYREFANRVEALIQHDVEAYISEIAQDKEKKDDKDKDKGAA